MHLRWEVVQQSALALVRLTSTHGEACRWKSFYIHLPMSSMLLNHQPIHQPIHHQPSTIIIGVPSEESCPSWRCRSWPFLSAKPWDSPMLSSLWLVDCMTLYHCRLYVICVFFYLFVLHFINLKWKDCWRERVCRFQTCYIYIICNNHGSNTLCWIICKGMLGCWMDLVGHDSIHLLPEKSNDLLTGGGMHPNGSKQINTSCQFWFSAKAARISTNSETLSFNSFNI